MPNSPGDDILNAIQKGANDQAVIKQFGIGEDLVKSFKSLSYGLTNNKISKDDIGDYYPELKTYFQAPVTGPTESLAEQIPGNAQVKQTKPVIEMPKLPKLDFTKPVEEPAAAESVSFGEQQAKQAAPAMEEEAQHDEFLHQKYDPLVASAAKDILSDKSKYVQNSRPALNPHPEAPDSYFESLNMPAVDEYLKNKFPDINDRYYIRNRLKQYFQQRHDQFDIQQLSEQKLQEMPGYAKADKVVRAELGDKIMDISKQDYLANVVAEMKKDDPNISEKINKIYTQAIRDNEENKNEFLRAEMDNTFGGIPVAEKAPFHDQITGAAKALQGFFKFSGQVGQLASDLMEIVPAKAAQEAAYKTRNVGEKLLEETKFPQGNKTVSEYLGGELEPMLLQAEAFGRLARFTGMPIYKLLAGARAADRLGKIAEGALGGMATAPANAYMISRDYYHNLVQNGELPEIAQSKAEDVFNKNLVTDMAISPLQFGIMNVPVKGLNNILKTGLASSVAGAHFMLQDYYQQHENNPTLSLWNYIKSPEGLKTGLTGAAMGIIQHYAIGKINDWQTKRATKDALSFNRSYNPDGTPELPSNNVIANNVLNALEMKPETGRAEELKNLIDEMKQRGVYNEDEAKRISNVIDDVQAVRAQVPKIGTTEQKLAVFNELLNQREILKRKAEAGEQFGKVFDKKINEINGRIEKILSGEEPLYFINGYETNKNQLLSALQAEPALLNRNTRIKVFNDPETVTAINNIKNDYETKTKATSAEAETGNVEQTGAKIAPVLKTISEMETNPETVNAFDKLEAQEVKAEDSKTKKVREKAANTVKEMVASMPERAQLVHSNFDEITRQLKEKELLKIDCA